MFACVLSRFSRIRLFATQWTVATRLLCLWDSPGKNTGVEYHALPCPPPGDLPDPGIELVSLMSPALTDRFFTARATWEATYIYICACVCVCGVMCVYVCVCVFFFTLFSVIDY